MVIVVLYPVFQKSDHFFFERHFALNFMGVAVIMGVCVVMVAVINMIMRVMIVVMAVIVMMRHKGSF